MTLIPGSPIPQSLLNVVQSGFLERLIREPLVSEQLYRMDSKAEEWQGQLGETVTFTRRGLMAVKITPLTPGSDPAASNYSTEQWTVTAAQYADSNDTFMPASNIAIESTLLNNARSLATNAAQTMNRLARNKLFQAYNGGVSSVFATGTSGTPTLKIASLAGFTERLNPTTGKLAAVSASNPLPITFSSAEPANTVIGAVPDSVNDPFGPGTLTLGTNLSAAVATRVEVRASTRAKRFRVGAGATIDSITGSNILTLSAIVQGVSRLRQMNVRPHPDGYYHVHLSPVAEAQIFQDADFKSLHQSLPNEQRYQQFIISTLLGCKFIRNTDDPNSATVTTLTAAPGGAGGAFVAGEIGGEVINANGIGILRTIITGDACVFEKYFDESAFVTAAGVNGKIGNFSLVQNSVQLMLDRIRYVARAPQDKLQQMVTQSWSWSGDFGVPSDELTGDASRFKRAFVIEHSA